MNLHRSLLLLTLALVALAPVIAEAAGQITGVTAAPSPATVGGPVTLTVTGTGTCAWIIVDFGDGEFMRPHQEMVRDISFPKNIRVTDGISLGYKAPGTFQITATPYSVYDRDSGCTGIVHTDLKVLAAASYTTRLHQLAQHPVVTGATGGGGSGQPRPGGATGTGTVDIGGAGAPPPPPPPPQITGTIQDEPLGAVPVKIDFTMPGLLTFVRGVHFGATPGFLRMALLTYKGETIYRDLEIQSWGDTLILARVPDKITEVKDQPGAFWVVTSTGQVSTVRYTKFVADRDTKRLTSQYPARAVTDCSKAGTSNLCLAQGDTTFAASHKWSIEVGWCTPETSYATFGIYCTVRLTDLISASASGHDEFKFCLKNDWVYDHDEWAWQDGIDGGPVVVGREAGCTYLHQRWFYDVYSSAGYGLSIVIRGPRDVPEQ